jgi:hypothetical protein
MVPLIIGWVGLGLLTLSLALYRKVLAWREETYAHSSPSAQRPIGQQLALYRRMGAVDRWGPKVAVATALFGVVLAVAVVAR